MVYLRLAFLALASGCNALTTPPAGSLALESPSYDDPVDIFPQSRAPTISNSTGSALGRPILPYPDIVAHCSTAPTPPFRGGQLMYSLLSELSTLWQKTDNPVIQEPIRTRNLPFYSILITIAPERAPRSALTQSDLANYMYKIVKGLVGPNIHHWPGPLSCRLSRGTSQLIGKLEVTPVPIITSDLPTVAAANETLATFGDNSTLGTTGLSIHHNFQGAKTTDRNALYLFTAILTQFYQGLPSKKLTDHIPPGQPTKHFLTADRTFWMWVLTYPGPAISGLTVKEFAEGVIRMLLLMAVKDRWESFTGDVIYDDQTIGSVYMAPYQSPDAEGSGQNWSE